MAASERTSQKDSIITKVIAVVLLIAGFWLAYQFVEPPPPTTITISTGSEEGAYYSNALKYKKLLAEQGITLNIETSAGSSENLQRLLAGDIDAAFFIGSVQSPVIQQLLNEPSVALASLQHADAYQRLHPFLSKLRYLKE